MTQNRQGTGPHSPVPAPPSFWFSPKVGVTGMVVALVLVVVAMVAAALYGSSDTSAESGEPGAPGGVAPVDISRIPLEHVDDLDLDAMFPEHASRGLEEELRAWFLDSGRRPINDRDAQDEPEWVEHLLGADVLPRMDRLPPRVFGQIENVPRALDEPGNQRGTLVLVWGRVDEVREDTLRLADRDVPVWRLTITDAWGVPWVATTTAPLPEDRHVGEWVKVCGVFTKLWPLGDRPALHAFSSRAPLPSFPRVTERAPRVEWLEQVDDATPPSSTKIEDAPFYGMLNYVRHLGTAGYAELRDTERLQIEDMTGTAGATRLVEEPQVWRFRAVRLRLSPLAREFVVDGALPENPGNIETVYRGYAVDDQMRPVMLVSPFPKETFDLEGVRNADFEGFFFKRRMAQGQNDKSYWLPILIWTSATPLQRGGLDIGGDWRVIVGVVAGGSLLMLGLLAFTWRRARVTDAEVRRRAAERRTQRGSPRPRSGATR